MSAEWAENQIKKFQFTFDEADKDKSGSLNLDEVYEVLKKQHFRGSKFMVKMIFKNIDTDANQSISRDEFNAAIKNLPKMTREEMELRTIFQSIDKNGNGYLTKEEIMSGSSQIGVKVSEEQFKRLMISIEADSDGKIRYDEFLRLFGIQSAATYMSQVFEKLDADRSGSLKKDEILDVIANEPELKLSSEKVDELIKAFETDADGKLSYREFLDVWLKQK